MGWLLEISKHLVVGCHYFSVSRVHNPNIIKWLAEDASFLHKYFYNRNVNSLPGLAIWIPRRSLLTDTQDNESSIASVLHISSSVTDGKTILKFWENKHMYCSIYQDSPMQTPSLSLIILASIMLTEILTGSVKNDFHQKYLTSTAWKVLHRQLYLY